MKIARVGTKYIIIVWALVIAMLGTVLFFGYRRNSADLKQLMVNEAERLVEVVSVSSRAGIHALDEVEYLAEQRLLENARLIERLARYEIPSPDSLTRIAQENNLFMINILDNSGKSLSRSFTPQEPKETAVKQHHPEVNTVLSGESGEEIIGFMDGTYYS